MFVLGAVVVATLWLGPAGAQDGVEATGIRGAGSTFAYPILSKWSREYRLALARGGEFPGGNSGLDDPSASSALDYEPIGSLAGTLRVKAARVDFGASDAPMRSEELARSGLGQFPIVIGGIVAVVNLEGVGPGQIRFTGPVLADIFLGRITLWSDPRIQALNPDLRLPDAKIAVVHRSDGSGTTFNFTNYLSKVSQDWQSSVGSDLLVSWPIGAGVKGNDGIARAVQQTKHAIGYVEFAQALQSKLSFALLQNRAGRFIRPDIASFQSAASSADWSKTSDFHLLLTDVPGEKSYPIVATVFVLMPKTAAPRRTRAALDFFRWSLEHGARDASRLGYVPLPTPLVDQIKIYWSKNFSAGR